jgi:hypothetical protein
VSALGRVRMRIKSWFEEMAAGKATLLLSIVAFATLLAAAGLQFAVSTSEARAFWAGYLSNISAGFFTSAAILFFIDRAIEQRDEAIRKRLSALAARRMESPLYQVIGMFHAMISAAAPTPLTPRPTSCAELFSPENLRHLDWLDLQARSYYDDKPWCITLYEHLKDVLEEIRDIARAYESRLHHEFLESIELLLEDDFYVVLRSICVTASRVARREPLSPGEPYPVGLNIDDARRAAFFNRFTSVVEHAGRALGKRIGPDNVTAAFGRVAGTARLRHPHPVVSRIMDPQNFPG